MAVIINGNLWTCQHVGLDSPNGTYSGDQSGSSVNRSGIQWWKLQLHSTGTPLAPPVLIQAGSAYYVPPSARWGDYSFTSVGPSANQTFWTVQSFATANRKNWSDWIVSVKPAP